MAIPSTKYSVWCGLRKTTTVISLSYLYCVITRLSMYMFGYREEQEVSRLVRVTVAMVGLVTYVRWREMDVALSIALQVNW